jgi:hypothetical protein
LLHTLIRSLFSFRGLKCLLLSALFLLFPTPLFIQCHLLDVLVQRNFAAKALDDSLQGFDRQFLKLDLSLCFLEELLQLRDGVLAVYLRVILDCPRSLPESKSAKRLLVVKWMR